MRAKRVEMMIVLALFVAAPLIAGTDNQTPSVLSRLQTVEDPELGELIRAAIENRHRYYEKNEEKELEIMRRVTESYAQIKLLDRQIELLDRKVQSAVGPDELQYELILARAELDAKRTTELANLREIIGVMPDFPLSSKPTERLKTWLKLDVLDSRILVSKGVQPFGRKAYQTSYVPVGLMSKAEVIKMIGKHFSPKDSLPIRIDIYRTADGLALSKELEQDVITQIQEAKVQMQAEVHLDDSVRATPEALPLYIERGRIARYRNQDRRRIPGMYLQSFIEPNDVGQYVRRQLMTPGYLPAMWDVIYDPSSRELSIQIAQEIQQAVKSMGLGNYVTVRRTMEELDSERQYLGRWETTYNGNTLAITIMEEGKCRLLTKNQDTVAGSWAVKNDKLCATIENETILGHIDSTGNLVIESEGSTGTPMSFERAD